jgi:hypothetical protein
VIHNEYLGYFCAILNSPIDSRYAKLTSKYHNQPTVIMMIYIRPFTLFAVLMVTVVGGFVWFATQANGPAETLESRQRPVISRLDILHATDLVSGVKLAITQNDPNAIDEWLDKAIDLGEAANLSKEDMVELRSERAKNYVVFHAKRQLFNDAVEQAYFGLMDIEPIKAQYPEALSLFADADKLISERNRLIKQIATELANGQQVNDKILMEAQQHWRQRYAARDSHDADSE